MPDSPPKRVTRARAKVIDDGVAQSKITRITTASAKISAEKKPKVESVKTTKRKSRAEGGNDDVEMEKEKVTKEPAKKEPTKTRGRQKKTQAETGKDALKVDDLAPHKTRSAKPIIAEEISAEGPKPRGRPKKAISAAPAVLNKVEAADTSAPAKKSVRGRPTTITAKPATTKQLTKAPATRKKVKFQDEDEKDKENVPLQVKAAGKPTVKTTGLRAKPIRKPTTKKIAPRSKMIEVEKKEIEEVSAEKQQPLSPKKVTQIAKSSSIGSEDELGCEKTPVRSLSISPIKPRISPIREMNQVVSKIDFGNTKTPSSPVRSVQRILASPARRPALSPFKDAFKESPKRVNLDESIINPSAMISKSPAKASLLQSPARRLVVPPIQLNVTMSPTKSGFAFETATNSKPVKNLSFPPRSPGKTFSSPLRSLRTPGQAHKINHVNTARKQTASELNSPDILAHSSPDLGSSPDNGLLSPVVASTMEFVQDAHSVLNLSSSPSQVPTPAAEKVLDGAESVVEHHPFPTDLEPPVLAAPVFSFASPPRYVPEDSESEDELTSLRKSYAPTPFGRLERIKNSSSTPSLLLSRGRTEPAQRTSQAVVPNEHVEWTPIPQDKVEVFAITPLATQLSTWLASSAEKTTPLEPKEQKRGLFSPAGPTLLERPGQRWLASTMESPPKSSFFDDEMATRDEHEEATTELQVETEDAIVDVGASMESRTSSQYGDENAVPLDPQLIASEPVHDDLILTCTPARVFPMQLREIHTVSKVPLRAEGEESPLKIPKKRSRSLAAPLSMGSTEKFDFGPSNDYVQLVEDTSTSGSIESADALGNTHSTPSKACCGMPKTPGTGLLSIFGTPMRSVRKGIVPDVLKGAVVYVDVHTTEGADASGIFLDLLTQMGARCVKQWLWNSRSGVPGSGDDSADPSTDLSHPGSKVGITHVVYKDGGKRTLEKVREAKGVVLCVGVGWVLELVNPLVSRLFS